ncbi:MAG: DUF4834 family protein [Bacteroidota bacterium]
MLKFIIISILVIYLIFRLIGFGFRIMFGAAYEQQKKAQQGQRRQYTAKRRAPNSNLNIDTPPEKSNGSTTKQFQGGDYIDYEEVKD